MSDGVSMTLIEGFRVGYLVLNCFYTDEGSLLASIVL